MSRHRNADISTGYDALKAIRSGSADLAVVVPEYDAKALHLHKLFKSFPAGPEGQEQVNFFRKVYQEVPALTRELEASNVHRDGLSSIVLQRKAIIQSSGHRGSTLEEREFLAQRFSRERWS